jgi:hypothetical protein
MPLVIPHREALYSMAWNVAKTLLLTLLLWLLILSPPRSSPS